MVFLLPMLDVCLIIAEGKLRPFDSQLTESTLHVARILVIEDHEVVLVQNGLDGLEKARSNYFDLLILDIMLPKIDGRERFLL